MIRASSRVFGAERALRRLLSILSVVGSAVAFADSLAAQQGTVAGQVLNTASGQPLVAAQVFISDLDLGVLTQPTGRYLILNVPAGSHTVTVQSIGYRPVTAEVTVVAGETVVQNFQISEQAIGLDEIIVTGTPGGTQRRALGNVVSSVNSNAIATSPAGTVEQVLQGRIPNVRLDVGSGLVGADAGPIRIRGSSSIGLSNDPIVYVDGRRMNVDRSFPGGTTGTGAFSRMNDINPADIASIEVIKGPAAATLYGTEAAHGVIQIITKRGASGATRFDASVEYGQNWIPNPEWQSVLPTIWGKNSNGDLISLHLYKQETLRNGGKPLFQNGPIQRYSLSATGGTDRIQYFASINRDDLEGFVDWNTDTKTNARLNLTSNVSETLSFEIQGSYLTGSTRHPGNLWAEFRRGTPNTAADVGGTTPTQLRGYGVRPFEAWRDGSSDILEIERNSWGGTLNWNPVGWLKGRVVLGNDVSEETRNQLVIRELNWPNGFYGQGGEGSKNIDIIRNINRTADASASATLALTDQVGSVTSVGLQYYAKRVRTIASNGAQFALPALSTVSATARPGSGETEFENVTVGAYLQQQFDWQQRIFVTGAVRADDNSAFGAAFDLVYYPKVSATWVLHEESFWNLDFLSQMRLRGAYGQAGKQPGVFASTRLFQPRAGTGDVSYLTPLQFGNPDLGPEKTSELEIGFDAAAFEDRVGIEFTWYSKKTRDAIIEAPVAPSLGFPGFRFVNIGQVSNWGMELALDLAVLQGDQLSADLNISGGTTYSRIDDMGTLSEIAVRRTRRHVEGYPLAAQFERKVVSADWVTGPGGAVTNVQCDGGTGADGRRMGGVPVPCAAAPRVWWGRQSEPTWTMQASPTVTIRQNLRLSALFYAQGGNMVGSDALYNAEIAWVNTYKAQVNDDLLYVAQKSVAPPALGYYNGGYAKLREVSLSYTLPAQLAGRIGASQASVSIAGRNMGILWQEQKLSYLAGGQTGDPEKNNIPTEEFTGEPTSGTMPPSSSIVATVRVSF